MTNGWIKTTECGNYIDSKAELGYSYQEVERVQCPHCKEKYPTVSYIVNANYCPECGKAIKIVLRGEIMGRIEIKVFDKDGNDVTNERDWYIDTNGILYMQTNDIDSPLYEANDMKGCKYKYNITFSN